MRWPQKVSGRPRESWEIFEKIFFYLDGYYEQKYIKFHWKNAKFSIGDETTPILKKFWKKRKIRVIAQFLGLAF